MTFYLTIHIIVCVLLIVVILAQDGKAGGLTSVADSSQAMFGAKGAASFLTKLTSVLAITYFVTSLALAFLAAPSNKSIAADFQPTTEETTEVTSETKSASDGGVTIGGADKAEVKKSSEMTAEEREQVGLPPAPAKPADKKDDGEQKDQ